VLDEVGGETLVLYMSTGHYRQPLAFSPDSLEAAGNAVRRIREAGRRLAEGESPAELAAHRDAFFDALAEDFNTARALPALYEWIGAANKLPEGTGDSHLREMLGVLGLESLLSEEEGPPAEAVELAQRRADSRAAKDWGEADRLRDELRELGWEVRDGPQGPELVRAS
jgi:cysteinyl-tRNA synthetase